MKKLHKIMLVFISCLLALTMLAGCVVKPPFEDDQGEHTVHIDENNDGKCDKCGEEMPVDHTEHYDDDKDGKCDKCGEEMPVEVDPRAEAYSYMPQITEEMPVIRISTENTDWVTKPNRSWKLNGMIDYVEAKISVDHCDEKYELSDIDATVKVRGNYTLEYPKKPIRIKFNKKQAMVGLNGGEKFKSWVLLADWKDLSMSNNTTAFYLGNTILGSDGYYCSDYRNVEVYINGQYWGVYLLAEQQQTNEGRTSLTEPKEGYTGTDIGYLFEYDGYWTNERDMPNGMGDPTFTIAYNNVSTLKGITGGNIGLSKHGYTIANDIYDDAQVDFIASYTENVFKIAYEAVYNNNFYKFNDTYTGIEEETGKTAQEVVSAVIDVQSLVDMYILHEIACDPDIAWSSFFLSADMGPKGNKKLTFQAPWDFDSAFGVRSAFTMGGGNGWFAATGGGSYSGNPWLLLLVTQDWFQEMVRAKWAELCKYGVLTTALDLIEEQKTVYENYYIKNYVRWEERITGGNSEVVDAVNRYHTQADGANYLYRWLYTRFNFLNAQWGNGGDILEDPTDPIPEEPEEGAIAYRYEAENCILSGSCTAKTGNGSSADGYLGNVSGAVGNSITITVTAESDTSAYLYIGLSKRNYSASFNGWFSVTVNGKVLRIPNRIVPELSAGEEDWHAWYAVKLAPVELSKGTNTIVFTTVTSSTTNVDYFDLWSTVTLS